jgi:WD40 repeat protein
MVTARLKGHNDAVELVAFSPDGKVLASIARRQNVVLLWDVERGSLRATLKPRRPVSSLLFTPDSKALLTPGDGLEGQRWDVATGTSAPFKGYVPVRGALSPDGKLVAFPDAEQGKVLLWDTRSSRPLATLKHGTDVVRIEHVTFSKDGKLLATSGNDGAAKLWDVAGRKLARTIPVGRRSIMAIPIALSPDGKYLASGGMEGMVKLWALKADSPGGR